MSPGYVSDCTHSLKQEERVKEAGMVADSQSPCAWEVEAGGSQVLDQLLIQNEYEASMDYVRLFPKIVKGGGGLKSWKVLLCMDTLSEKARGRNIMFNTGLCLKIEQRQI